MVTSAASIATLRTPRIRVPEFDPFRLVQITIPSGEQHVSEVRRLIERVSIPTWLTPEDVSDLKLAATEACLNAIRHGSPMGIGNVVGVIIRPTIDQVMVEIHDEGPGFDPRGTRRSAFPLGENGRGIKLIDTLVDRVEYHYTGRGQLVRLVKQSRITKLS